MTLVKKNFVTDNMLPRDIWLLLKDQMAARDSSVYWLDISWKIMERKFQLLKPKRVKPDFVIANL